MAQVVLDWNKYQKAAIDTTSEGIVMLENRGERCRLNAVHGRRFSAGCRRTITSQGQDPAEWLMYLMLWTSERLWTKRPD